MIKQETAVPTHVIPEVEPVTAPPARKTQRRHDVDWLRTLALGLLIFYHVTISFQPWAPFIGFIGSDKPLEGLWDFMSLINIWRIPILFLISGMGVCFAMERRNWWQLLQDRTTRILVPLVFGALTIVPVYAYVLVSYYEVDFTYDPELGHLWFLANIFAYVIILLPVLLYMKARPDNPFLRTLSRVFRTPFGLFLMTLPLIAEVLIIDPIEFAAYAETTHGFWLGMICFATGFLFVSLRDAFWPSAERMRWVALVVAFGLYINRVWINDLESPTLVLTAVEAMCWMLAIFGFGSVYLNKPSASLRYLSTAVYPVYIIHLPIQAVIAYYVMPMSMGAWPKLLIMLVGTFAISMLIYEFVLRRVKWVRPFFGMKFSYG